MISVDILGFGALTLKHCVLDYNGTLAVDGAMLPDVKGRLHRLALQMDIHVLTADTFGKARGELKGLRCKLVILEPGRQDRAKATYVRRLNHMSTVCIGNGRNDRLMLRTSALGISVIQGEGASVESIREADIVVTNVCDALDLLLKPGRLIAGLRN